MLGIVGSRNPTTQTIVVRAMPRSDTANAVKLTLMESEKPILEKTIIFTMFAAVAYVPAVKSTLRITLIATWYMASLNNPNFGPRSRVTSVLVKLLLEAIYGEKSSLNLL
ncbi:hypothetical protein RRG08_025421 [Elysia crispata]|uniref:Uncharacterized protein n=1 Tax=Elysia crispata TaxID=231223 RepID=A0AAE0Z8Y3_9GAST|nr:hypothetical protein RRG08_025421 [Elysia crispata]